MIFIGLWSAFTIGLILWVAAKKYLVTTTPELSEVERYEAWRMDKGEK